MSNKPKYCVLVPAYNEAKVIGKTLKYLTSFIPKSHIYVVDDGSKDKTAEIARKYTRNVLKTQNGGKASALNKGIEHFKLVKKYDFITPTDADSGLAEDFFEEILPVFATDKEIIGAVGKVVGSPDNWLTSYRLWEYEMAQLIHKNAQSAINAIVVCPGPCTVLRSSIFTKIKYPEGTKTEDMDLTFLIHRKQLGKIVHVPTALAFTQDPNTLSTYTKQIERWYVGFWQCVNKYQVPKKGKKLDFEVALLAAEGIFNGFFALSVFILLPFIALHATKFLLLGLVADLSILMIPTLGYTAHKYRAPKIFLYIPHFYFLRFYSSLIFLLSYGIVLTGKDKNQSRSWDTARYTQKQSFLKKRLLFN